MDDLRSSTPVIAIRRSRRRISRFFARSAVAMAVGPVILALVASVASTFGLRIPGAVVLDAWVFGWLAGAPLSCVGALIAGRRARVAGSRVEASGEGLAIDGELMPRTRMAGALHVAGERHETEISLVNGDVLHVEVEGAEPARAIVEALRFTADARRTVIELGDDHDALAAGCWGVVIGALVTLISTCGVFASSRDVRQMAGYILGLAFVLTSLFVARVLAPRRLVVGNDGVVFETMFGKQFIPITSIADVQMTERGIVLTLFEGTVYRTVALTSKRSERSAAVHERIASAVRAATSAGREATSALLARGGRSVTEWRDALRKLVRGGGYRGESVSMDALVRAAASAELDPEDRIGAALAIGLAEDGDAKKRLRIEVEGIANDELRAAMERAAEGAEGEKDAAAVEEAIAAAKKSRR